MDMCRVLTLLIIMCVVGIYLGFQRILHPKRLFGEALIPEYWDLHRTLSRMIFKYPRIYAALHRSALNTKVGYIVFVYYELPFNEQAMSIFWSAFFCNSQSLVSHQSKTLNNLYLFSHPGE